MPAKLDWVWLAIATANLKPKEEKVKRGKQIALWGLVIALVFSFSVCQNKVQEAKKDEPPKETTLSSASEEETKPVEESPAETEKAGEEKPVSNEEKTSEETAEKPAEEIARDDAAVIIELAKGGRIVFTFYPKDAPNTVDNFIKLTNKGFYDGLKFHRVIADFMAQTGCPLGTGTGGPGYKIKAEFNSQKHIRGTVAMARSQSPDSAGSQFYICYGSTPHLDGNYTVFGQVIEGMELVDGIVQGDVMKKVTIVDKASVTK